MEEVIRINHITKDYGRGKGVFDIDLSVKKGEVFGYLGPNGAGKTTTIRQLLGFIRPDQGSVSILGRDCFLQADRIKEDMGYLAGEIAFIEDMKGPEFLKFMADMKGMKDMGRMRELTERFELDPKGRIRKMSKGMKQKIGIICAFMNNPSVLILDEPTSGLDPLMQNRFIELILEEKKRGATILMSSHIFEEVERTCDRTAIIREGRIAAVEDMQGLAKKKKKTYCVTLGSSEEAGRLKENKRLDVVRVEKCRADIAVSGRVGEVLKELASYDVVDLEIKSQTLEELFLQYYGKKGDKI